MPNPKQRERDPTSQKPTDVPDKDPANHAGMNVFEEVLPDALHMIISFWPCSTDNLSTIFSEDNWTYIVPVEER